MLTSDLDIFNMCLCYIKLHISRYHGKASDHRGTNVVYHSSRGETPWD